MKFQFDPNQQYQLDAIASVVDIFDGQPRVGIKISALHAAQAFPNQLHLTPADIFTNLQTVQHRQNLPVDTALKTIPYPPKSNESLSTDYRLPKSGFPNFTIEMETGTGKTYVYLRTIFELHQRYGMLKFIVVVPSVAIREGVLKTLQITQEHFKQHYQNIPYRYYPYDSGNLNLVPQFAHSSTVQIMVMTLAAFNKDANVVYQSTDRLQGRIPMHLLQAARPILILDEPQNMSTAKSRAALATLHPLFALRYSATHRNLYNQVYRLTPFQAYQEKLVKRIEVAGIEEVDSENRPYIRLVGTATRKQTVTAKLAVHRLLKSGIVKETTITVRPGDNLEAKTNRSDYAAYTVEEIDVAYDTLYFTNGEKLEKGQATGTDKPTIWEQQITYTIEEHFRKQRRLLDQDIKVLSLFFIDRVDNYAHPDSPLRLIFNTAFTRIATQYPDVCQTLWDQSTVEPATVQAAYFANRNTRAGETIYLDSKTGESKRDKEVYDLIMKNKEQLLSLEEPVAFIFSHSALREGWDNPNVFQICTLNQTASEVKKRQEIGRGVRLAVNQHGTRIHDSRVNRLTVIANESYQAYVSNLQTEYAEGYDTKDIIPPPTNARDRKTIRRVKEHYLSKDFAALWNRIKHKTRYKVRINSEKLIRDVIDTLNQTEIRPPRIAIRKAHIQVHNDTLQAIITGQSETVTAGHSVSLPNLVTLMEDLLQRTTPPMRLSRHTLLEIYRRCDRQQEGIDNPFEFANTTVRILKDKLLEQLVDGIQYEPIGQYYEMSQFKLEFEAIQDYLVPATRSLYDQIVVDSAEEAALVQTMEADDRIKLYIKLPDWFTVPTPLGSYNPDWAIVFEERDAHGNSQDTLYLVREQKPTQNLAELRRHERLKILSATRHFQETLNVRYGVITKDDLLPGTDLGKS